MPAAWNDVRRIDDSSFAVTTDPSLLRNNCPQVGPGLI